MPLLASHILPTDRLFRLVLVAKIVDQRRLSISALPNHQEIDDVGHDVTSEKESGDAWAATNTAEMEQFHNTSQTF